MEVLNEQTIQFKDIKNYTLVSDEDIKSFFDENSYAKTMRMVMNKFKQDNVDSVLSVQAARSIVNKAITGDPDTKPEKEPDPEPEEDKEEDTSWMADPLADVTLTALKATKPAYEGERQEILNFVKQVFKDGLTDTELSALAQLSEDKNALELDDIEALFGHDLTVKNDGTLTDAEEEKYKLAQKVVKLLDDYASKVITNKASFPSVERAREIARKALSAKKLFVNLLAKRRKLNVDQSGIELPFQAPTSTDVSVYPGEEKTKIDPTTVEIFSEFFTQTTLEGRIEELKEFSQAVVNKRLNNYPPGQVINGAALLSMLSTATRTADGSAAGFTMEAFFAMMLGGEKTGQAQGAGDFQGPDGKSYSSKYSKGPSGTSQAASGFKTKNEVITYVIGGKRIDLSGSTSTAKYGTGAKRATQTFIGVEIGIFDVKTTIAREQIKVYQHGTAKALKYNGETNKIDKNDGKFDFGDTQTQLDNIPSKNKYIIAFVDSKEKSFKEAFSEALEASTQNTVKQVMKIYNRLKLIRESGTDLIKDNSVASAFSMADNYKTLKTEIEQLFDSVDVGMVSKVDLAENKKNQTKSLKDLDKLIERVILNKMLIK